MVAPNMRLSSGLSGAEGVALFQDCKDDENSVKINY